jgi:hypothetical protein
MDSPERVGWSATGQDSSLTVPGASTLNSLPLSGQVGPQDSVERLGEECKHTGPPQGWPALQQNLSAQQIVERQSPSAFNLVYRALLEGRDVINAPSPLSLGRVTFPRNYCSGQLHNVLWHYWALIEGAECHQRTFTSFPRVSHVLLKLPFMTFPRCPVVIPRASQYGGNNRRKPWISMTTR